MSDFFINERGHFAITTRYAYLNNASQGPLSPPATASIKRVTAEMQYCLPEQLPRMRRDLNEARSSIAELIGAPERCVGFVANTSSGLAMAAGSIPWKPGDNVILRRGEFPANVYPWLNLRRRSVEVRMLEDDPEGVSPDALLALLDENTRAVALSWVDFAHGARLDTAELGALCHQHGALFVVDAIQGVGALEVDLENIDVLVCGGGKWTLAPQGGGFVYLAPEILDDWLPDRQGWLSVVPNADLEFHRLTDYELPLAPDARRVEEGSCSPLTQLALGASCGYLQRLGPRRIEKHIVELCDYLIDGLEERGVSVISPRVPGRRSGIVSFSVADPEAALRRLHDADVIISLREGLLRAGIHFFNNREDIDRLLAELPTT